MKKTLVNSSSDEAIWALLCFRSSLGATRKNRYRKNPQRPMPTTSKVQSSIKFASARSRWMKAIKDDDRK